MKTTEVIGWALGVGLFVASPGAWASYPAGVWLKAKSVSIEKTSPPRVKIDCAAMLYDKSSGTSYAGYSEPDLGYLYYECPAGKEATCLSEWADVHANVTAGDETCVGLGDQSLPTGALRKSGSATNPDAYPIAMGVLSGYMPCQVLAKFLASAPDAGSGGAAGAGGSSSSGGSAGDGGASTGGTTSTGGATSSGGTTSTGGAGGAINAAGSSSGGAAGSSGSSMRDESSADAGGCSTSGSSGLRGFFAWATLAGAALALRRRRRS